MSKYTYNNPFLNEGLKGIKFPWLDTELILESHKRNMDLINTTQQIAAETTKAVIQIQTQYMKDVFDQLSEQSKQNISPFPTEEKVTNQSEATKATLDQALVHTRNINTLIAKSSEKIIDNVQKRLKEGVDESAALAKKAKTKNTQK